MSARRLIVFCGIDGSGKSSLVARMRRDGWLDDAVYLRKETLRDARLVNRYHSRQHGDGRDWVSGPYAHAIGLATVFDFLDHYDTNIRPALETHRHIVCDRYWICYAAYLRSTGYPLPLDELARGLARPDLIVYVRVPVHVAVERYALRGGASEDETPEVMHRFEAAYRELLPRAGCPVLEISNDRDFEETYEELASRLPRALHETEDGHGHDDQRQADGRAAAPDR